MPSATLAACLGASGDVACFTVGVVADHLVGVPSGLAASASGGTVTLTWGGPSSGDPVTGYIVEAGSASGLSNLASLATGSTATTLTVPNVPNGTYYVRVRAVSSGGAGAASNEVTLVVGPTGGGCQSAPNPPTDMNSSLSGTTLTLTWRAPTGGCVESYIIEGGTTETGADLANFDTGSTSTTFTTDLGNALTADGLFRAAADAAIHARVRARNQRGRSGPSNTTRFTKTSAPPTRQKCLDSCTDILTAAAKACDGLFFSGKIDINQFIKCHDNAHRAWTTCNNSCPVR